MVDTVTYSTGCKIAFWLLWLLGVIFLLVFFLLYASSTRWIIGAWYLLVSLIQGIILIISASGFQNRAKPARVLILQAGLAAIGIPIIVISGWIMLFDVNQLIL